MTTEEAASRTWGAGGHGYDEISFMVSDALAHAAQRLQPQPGEKMLDVATGTGWTARNLARLGANVTAIDFSQELLAAAKALSAHAQPPIEFELADAQALPFEDGCFDAVVSTFGVMFAPDHRSSAAELARVCRPGGRLCLTTWPPEGMVADFFKMLGPYTSAPPPDPSPLLWGDRAHLEGLLGDAFELAFEPGINRSYHHDGEQIACHYEQCFGPTKQLHETLDADRRASLHRDLIELHEAYRVEIGLVVERPYLLILGTRR